MNVRTLRCSLAACLFILLTVPVSASDPMGAYCLVDKVVLEPADAANTVQIWGTCALANTNDWYFQAPAKGYFYFAAPKGQDDRARAEWSDMKSVAGTGQVIGFARRYKPVGRIRPATEKPAQPDDYPLHLGVTRATQRTVPEVREVVAAIQKVHGR